MVRITNTNSIYCKLKEPNNEILPSRPFTKSCAIEVRSRRSSLSLYVTIRLFRRSWNISAEVIVYIYSFVRSIRSRYCHYQLNNFTTSPIKALLAGVRLRQYLNTSWMFEQKLFPFLDSTVTRHDWQKSLK